MVAVLLERQGKRTAAGTVRELAQEHLQAALRLEPPGTSREFRRRHYWSLADLSSRFGDHRGAVEAVDALLPLVPDDWLYSYNAGCVLALCVPWSRRDPGLSAGDRQALARQYADRAIDLLHAAVAQGFRDIDHLKADTDLDSIRTQPGFEKVVAALQTALRTADGPGSPSRQRLP
jgi:hypothetical protein